MNLPMATGESYQVIRYNKGHHAFVCQSKLTIKDQATGESKPLVNVLHQGKAEECYRYSDYFAQVQEWLAECRAAKRVIYPSPEFQS